ncbi:MAG: hypothetical protein WCR72_01825 [Bacteroidota bacterium]
MKTKKCEQCQNFIKAVWRDDYDKPLKMIEKAKCTEGKRVRFVVEHHPHPFSFGEYRRKCELFKQL